MTTDLTSAYAECARITRAHGTTYYWGVRLLAPDQRNDVFAIYALCRVADDIVDAAGATESSNVADTARRLTAFAGRFFGNLESGDAAPAVIRAAAATAREREIPRESFERFFAAMQQDLTVSCYPCYTDLLGYMDGSAAVIGEMMLPILRPTDERALTAARSLGLAFQLTNFLRDVAEDERRGRCYLPLEDLERFGVKRGTSTVTDAWRELMAFEIDRTRALYARADLGIGLLPPRAARCVLVARELYGQILDLIEAADYDVFSVRHRVPTWRKAALAARGLVLPATLGVPTSGH